MKKLFAISLMIMTIITSVPGSSSNMEVDNTMAIDDIAIIDSIPSTTNIEADNNMDDIKEIDHIEDGYQSQDNNAVIDELQIRQQNEQNSAHFYPDYRSQSFVKTDWNSRQFWQKNAGFDSSKEFETEDGRVFLDDLGNVCFLNQIEDYISIFSSAHLPYYMSEENFLILKKAKECIIVFDELSNSIKAYVSGQLVSIQRFSKPTRFVGESMAFNCWIFEDYNTIYTVEQPYVEQNQAPWLINEPLVYVQRNDMVSGGQ